MSARPPATLALLSSALLVGCSLLGLRSGYETPPYEVVGAVGKDVEIRRYGPRLVAQTTVQGLEREQAMDEAFRILARYVFAEERAGEKVSMTAPVQVEPAVPIGMTSPVEARDAGRGVTMRFTMPARYTRETLPPPEDERVRIVELPAQTLAALRFTGLGRARTVQARRTELLAALEETPWAATAFPSTLYYDPPWTIPFLRRNEVVAQVEERGR